MRNGTENNVTVNLEEPIPVLIVYDAAAAEDKNNAFFFDDVYGYDKELDVARKRGLPTPPLNSRGSLPA